MPSSKVKKRKHEAIKALSLMGRETWSIEDQFFGDLVQSIEQMSIDGMVPTLETHPSSDRYAKSKMLLVGTAALIPIVGVIRPHSDFYTKYYGATSCQDLKADFNAALGNAHVNKIVFLVDSPGGSVFQLEETSSMIHQGRDKKEVTTHVLGMCASAAYFLGSSASTISATPSAVVGSIGAKTIHVDLTEYYKKWGVKVTDIYYGKHKTDGSPYRPLDSQGRKSMQSTVDAFGDQFTNAVARNRGITQETVLNTYGQGKIFLASKALQLGMIDSVAELNITGDGGSSTNHSAEAQSSQFVALNVIETSSAAASSPTPKAELPKVDRIKAMLFGMSMIASLDATEAEAVAAFTGWCKAKGIKDFPVADGKITDILEAVAILDGSSSKLGTELVSTIQTTAPEAAASNVQAAKDQEVAEAREAALKSYRERRDNVESIASLINQVRPGAVSSEEIRTAVDGSESPEAIRKTWQAKLSTAPAAGAVSTGGNIGGFVSGEDTFAAAASATLLARCGVELNQDEQTAIRNASDVQHMSMMDMAHRSLQLMGMNVLAGTPREEVALAALRGAPGDLILSFSSNAGGIVAADSAVNRPGSFPNVLSNLAGKYLDRGLSLVDTSYQEWASRLPDTSDFKPDTYMAMGSFTTLDAIPDGDDYKELKMKEELQGWISVERHGNAVKMTPVMMINDASGLDAFAQHLKSMGYAHNNTINELCLQLLTGNAVLPDGTPIFAASRGNLIAAGAAPSAIEAEKMKLAHMQQKGITRDGKKRIKTMPNLILVGPKNHTPALQTYAPFSTIPESKQSETDGNINVHRGTLSKIVLEQDLDDYEGGDPWYTFDTRIRTIAYQFMAGYGSGGRRVSWFETKNQCRHFGLEGRFGTNALGRGRGAVKNPGK